jgi:nucleoside-diphosphate-sugar epimerase
VNFNWPISTFEPYIRGVRHLIDFSIASAHHSFLLFVSSVAAVGQWDKGKAPEKSVHDLQAASMGYGQSKLIAECLLNKAATFSGVRSSCCRVGIIAGPVEKRGVWNRHEYIPSVSCLCWDALLKRMQVIISSAHLGVFPATFPSRDKVDWLPVDKVSDVLLEILQLSCTEGAGTRNQTYHVVNPNTTSWSKLVPWILASYNRDVEVVSFEKWLDALSQSAEADVDPEKNPAVRLLDFYQRAKDENPRKLQTQDGQARRVLQEVGPVNRDWVNKWMQQWGFEVRNGEKLG